MTVVMLIALTVWAAMLLVVLALCASASRGDAALRISAGRGRTRRFGRGPDAVLRPRTRGRH